MMSLSMPWHSPQSDTRQRPPVLTHLPNQILCVAVADQLLLDQEARALTTATTATLHAMKGYRIKQDLPIEMALRHHNQWHKVDAAASSSSSSRTPSPLAVQLLRFGHVQGVIVGGPLYCGLPPIAFNPFAPTVATSPAVEASPDARPLTLDRLQQQQLNALPASVRRLSTGYTFNLTIDSLHLPSSLRSLRFGAQFDQRLDLVVLPSDLEEIYLGDHWNRSITQLPKLHEGLKKLIFGRSFNQPMTGLHLPTSLVLLEFGASFCQPVEEQLRLPPNLESLRFGAYFNQPIERLPLPASLTQLSSRIFFHLSVV